jgi:hypothetical protein
MTMPAPDYGEPCEEGRCRHELAAAVTLADLRTGDGPHRTPRRFATFDTVVAERDGDHRDTGE